MTLRRLRRGSCVLRDSRDALGKMFDLRPAIEGDLIPFQLASEPQNLCYSENHGLIQFEQAVFLVYDHGMIYPLRCYRSHHAELCKSVQ